MLITGMGVGMGVGIGVGHMLITCLSHTLIRPESVASTDAIASRYDL